MRDAKNPGSSQTRLLWGLGFLGFASFYREGFEVVLFLQSYRLQMGGWIVFYGALLGAFFAGIVAILTFVGHHRLPYKKMLVFTGILLAMVLFIMVGEQINEMQLVGWLGTTSISWLQWVPAWAGTWFSVFPNWQTVIAQVAVIGFILGCYFLARYQALLLPKKRGLAAYELREAPPMGEVVDVPISPLGAR